MEVGAEDRDASLFIIAWCEVEFLTRFYEETHDIRWDGWFSLAADHVFPKKKKNKDSKQRNDRLCFDSRVFCPAVMEYLYLVLAWSVSRSMNVLRNVTTSTSFLIELVLRQKWIYFVCITLLAMTRVANTHVHHILLVKLVQSGRVGHRTFPRTFTNSLTSTRMGRSSLYNLGGKTQIERNEVSPPHRGPKMVFCEKSRSARCG